MFFSSPATGSSASSWPEPRLTVRLNTIRQTENSKQSELQSWLPSDSPRTLHMPGLDSILTLMVRLFVFYIQFVIHTNIGRYGGGWEEGGSECSWTRDVTFLTNISPHLQELTVT